MTTPKSSVETVEPTGMLDAGLNGMVVVTGGCRSLPKSEMIDEGNSPADLWGRCCCDT